MPKFFNQPYLPNYDQKVSYDASNRQEYIGHSLGGKLVSEAKWQIFRIEYDSSNRPITRRFAGGNDKFDKVWNERTTYDYIDIS